MINHLDRDLAGLGFLKRDGGVGVQRAPGGLVDLGAQGAFEFVVGFVGAGEVGVADDETSTTSSVIPSSVKQKCRFGSSNGELRTGFSITNCFI